MSGSRISVADIGHWSAEAVREVFLAARDRGHAAFDASAGLAALDVFDDWGGDTAVAAGISLRDTRVDLDDQGQEALAVAHAANSAADGIAEIKARLATLIADAGRHRLTVNATTSRVEFTDKVADPVDALIAAMDLQGRLDAILRDADAIDDLLAAAIDMADGDAPIPTIPGPMSDREDRLQNQIVSFTTIFGRSPTSAADWETAAELDPHSYDPKNRGVDANVVVGRIQPLPGQGVVRMNLFIPSSGVFDPAPRFPVPFDVNAGDDRGFDPMASPESNRVALEVDYENGLVIARQNPSVDATTRQVRAGNPNVRVAQRPDGSVYINYAAADPFSPGGQAVAKASVCVRGEVVVRPEAGGVRVGGMATSYPALEIYHDRPVGYGGPLSTTVLAQRWPPITAGPWGPLAGLPLPLPVGDPTMLPSFKGWKEFVPFVTVPTTALGSPANTPSVVVLQ